MSGNFTSKTLSSGYLSNTTTNIYQTPSATVSYLREFSLYNNSSSVVGITVYKNLAGSIYPWATLALNPLESAEMLDLAAITLSAFDSIEAKANVANVVSYGIHGVEEQ